jgi:hypothetical protein
MPGKRFMNMAQKKQIDPITIIIPAWLNAKVKYPRPALKDAVKKVKDIVKGMSTKEKKQARRRAKILAQAFRVYAEAIEKELK